MKFEITNSKPYYCRPIRYNADNQIQEEVEESDDQNHSHLDQDMNSSQIVDAKQDAYTSVLGKRVASNLNDEQNNSVKRAKLSDVKELEVILADGEND
jgi:hypothetical protein